MSDKERTSCCKSGDYISDCLAASVSGDSITADFRQLAAYLLWIVKHDIKHDGYRPNGGLSSIQEEVSAASCGQVFPFT